MRDRPLRRAGRALRRALRVDQEGFEVLTEAGYPEELAYFEVCHELELIINLIKRGGLDYMRYSISNTAEFGDYYTGPKIVDDAAKQRMAAALKHIQDGSFAKAFRDDYANGFAWFKKPSGPRTPGTRWSRWERSCVG